MSYPQSGCMRRDPEQAEIVQFGIQLQNISGLAEAHRYLLAQGVKPTIIERVLSHPDRRRIIVRKADSS